MWDVGRGTCDVGKIVICLKHMHLNEVQYISRRHWCGSIEGEKHLSKVASLVGAICKIHTIGLVQESPARVSPPNVTGPLSNENLT